MEIIIDIHFVLPKCFCLHVVSFSELGAFFRSFEGAAITKGITKGKMIKKITFEEK